MTNTTGLITDPMAESMVLDTIPLNVLKTAKSMVTAPITIAMVHRVLDFIGEDFIIAVIAEGVTVDQLSRYLSVPSGMVQGWIFADDNRNRRINQAKYALAAEEGRAFMTDLLMDERSTLSKDEERMIVIKQKAAKHVQDQVTAPDPNKRDTGTVVHIDLSSALGL